MIWAGSRHQLAADGAARAGHQDPATGDQPAHGIAVEYGLRPAQQILDRHRTNVELFGRAVAELDETGESPHGHAEPIGGVDELANRRARDVVARQDQALRTLTGAFELGNHLGDVVESAENIDAMDVAADAAVALGDHADCAIELQLAAMGGTDEELGAIAGADEQDRDRLRIVVRLQQTEAAILDDAVEETRRADHEEEEDPVDHRNRARQQLGARQDEKRRHEDEDDDGRCLGEGEQIVDRSIAPDAAIKTQRPEDPGRHRRHQECTGDKNGGVIEDRLANSQIERQGKGQCRHDYVMEIGNPAVLQVETAHRAASLNGPKNTPGPP